MLACMPRAQGESVTLGAAYARFPRWCEDQVPAVAPLEATAFRAICERVKVRTEKRGGKVYICDVKLAA